MDTLTDFIGGFTDSTMAALFGNNMEPTEQHIDDAVREARVYGEACNRLVEKIGLQPRLYAKDQPIFGPIVRLFSLAGWTISGSGFFSVAFYKGGLALKVSLRGSGDAALDYLKWCRDNDGMPGLPKLYALGEFGHTYVALMDRYTPITGELDPDSNLYNPHLATEYEEVKAAVNANEFGWFDTAKTGRAIHYAFMGKGSFDLHKGNVMIDRNGGLVITDPLGRSCERETRYGGYEYSYYTDAGYSQAA